MEELESCLEAALGQVDIALDTMKLRFFTLTNLVPSTPRTYEEALETILDGLNDLESKGLSEEWELKVASAEKKHRSGQKGTIYSKTDSLKTTRDNLVEIRFKSGYSEQRLFN